MRWSTGLFAVGGLLYLVGLYGFATYLPGYRESLPREIEAIQKNAQLYTIEDRKAEEWRIVQTHAQWEAVLYPGFMVMLGLGMIAAGAGAIVYLKERRLRRVEPPSSG